MADSRKTLQYLNRSAFARLPVIAASGATPRPENIGAGALRLQFRGDMFNLFNHTNFSGVTTDISSGNFGRYTGTAGVRVIQLNARLSW